MESTSANDGLPCPSSTDRASDEHQLPAMISHELYSIAQDKEHIRQLARRHGWFAREPGGSKDRRLGRRAFLKATALGTAGAVIAACQPKTVVVRETVEVERVRVIKEIQIVKETVVVDRIIPFEGVTDIYEGVVNGHSAVVSEGIQIALDEGISPSYLLFEVLIPAMTEVGERFERNEFFVPEVLLAARAMQAGLAILKPLLSGYVYEIDPDECISCGACAEVCPVAAISEGEDAYEIDPIKCIGCGQCQEECPVDAISAKPRIERVGKIAIGTVKGDLHEIGKSVVAMMMEGAGFDVVDLGVDVSPDGFVQAAQDGVDVIAMSALLTTTMPSMKATMEALVNAGLREKVKVLIGGAPVTQGYADLIGADGYAPDASSGVRKAKELLTIQ